MIYPSSCRRVTVTVTACGADNRHHEFVRFDEGHWCPTPYRASQQLANMKSGVESRQVEGTTAGNETTTARTPTALGADQVATPRLHHHRHRRHPHHSRMRRGRGRRNEADRRNPDNRGHKRKAPVPSLRHRQYSPHHGRSDDTAANNAAADDAASHLHREQRGRWRHPRRDPLGRLGGTHWA